MTSEEMSAILRTSIDRTVNVTYRNGETDLALVLTVDDEGFVYTVVSPPRGERETPYWTAFSEIIEITGGLPESSK